MADLYRAECRRKHRGRWTSWKGKWHPDPTRAVIQATRWQEREPWAEVYITTHKGAKIGLAELAQVGTSLKSGNLKRNG